MGVVFCDELKKIQFKGSSGNEQNPNELLKVFDQLTRFRLESYSIVKELQNKLINLVSTKDQIQNLLHIMTRIDLKYDQKIIERLAKTLAANHLNALTYTELG
jgi:hypothetical protein